MNAEQLKVSCECTPVVDAQYVESDQSVGAVVVDALAEAAGVDPAELPPLYEFIDPDMLDCLVDYHDGRADTDAVVSFTVESWNVFVRADGRVRVCDAARHTDPQPIFEASTS